MNRHLDCGKHTLQNYADALNVATFDLIRYCREGWSLDPRDVTDRLLLVTLRARQAASAGVTQANLEAAIADAARDAIDATENSTPSPELDVQRQHEYLWRLAHEVADLAEQIKRRCTPAA